MAVLVGNSAFCLASALVVTWQLFAPKSATAPSANTLAASIQASPDSYRQQLTLSALRWLRFGLSFDRSFRFAWLASSVSFRAASLSFDSIEVTVFVIDKLSLFSRHSNLCKQSSFCHNIEVMPAANMVLPQAGAVFRLQQLALLITFVRRWWQKCF